MDKKRSGQIWKPPKAADWNAIAAAANLLARKNGNIDGNRDVRPSIDRNVIIVKNNSGGAREQFDVLILDGTNPLENDDYGNQWAGGDLELQSSEVVAVLLEPCESGSYARAAIDGVTWARVNLKTALDDHAAPEDGEHILQGGSSGSVAIIHSPAPTGYPSEEICLVLLNSVSTQVPVLPKSHTWYFALLNQAAYGGFGGGTMPFVNNDAGHHDEPYGDTLDGWSDDGTDRVNTPDTDTWYRLDLQTWLTKGTGGAYTTNAHFSVVLTFYSDSSGNPAVTVTNMLGVIGTYTTMLPEGGAITETRVSSAILKVPGNCFTRLYATCDVGATGSNCTVDYRARLIVTEIEQP